MYSSLFLWSLSSWRTAPSKRRICCSRRLQHSSDDGTLSASIDSHGCFILLANASSEVGISPAATWKASVMPERPLVSTLPAEVAVVVLPKQTLPSLWMYLDPPGKLGRLAPWSRRVPSCWLSDFDFSRVLKNIHCHHHRLEFFFSSSGFMRLFSYEVRVMMRTRQNFNASSSFWYLSLL